MSSGIRYRYTCECSNSHCGSTVDVPLADWERLARLGAVVHVDCVGQRRVIARFGEACAVRTTMVGMAAEREGGVSEHV
jgi:hypothetical protein